MQLSRANFKLKALVVRDTLVVLAGLTLTIGGFVLAFQLAHYIWRIMPTATKVGWGFIILGSICFKKKNLEGLGVILVALGIFMFAPMEILRFVLILFGFLMS